MKDFIFLSAVNSANAVANNGGSGLSDYLKSAIISTTVTGCISIIGFIVTYISMKRNFKNELEKQKSGMALEKMSTIPYEALSFYDVIMGLNKTKKKESEASLLNKMAALLNTIYAYGSENAIKITSLMQYESYLRDAGELEMDKYRVVAFYILLASQVKYDVTGTAVSPEMWYRMRIKDYNKVKERFKETNNKLVSELKLNEKFYI